MRTTIRIDDALLRQAKSIAARTGRSLAAVVEDALREAFSRRAAPAPRRRLRLPTLRSRLRPGVDLDDSASLDDLMTGPHAAP